MNSTPCGCNKPESVVEAWAPCRPWRVLLCLKCGEVHSTMGTITEWIWTWLIAPFWNGAVKIEKKREAKK